MRSIRGLRRYDEEEEETSRQGREKKKDPGNKSPSLSLFLSLFPYFSALLFILHLRNCNDRWNDEDDDDDNAFKSGRRKKKKEKKNNERSFTVRVFSPIIIAREKERKKKRERERELRKSAYAAYRSFLSFVVVQDTNELPIEYFVSRGIYLFRGNGS